jgi:hypothetical protein
LILEGSRQEDLFNLWDKGTQVTISIHPNYSKLASTFQLFI